MQKLKNPMCYHKQQSEPIEKLADYYTVRYAEALKELCAPRFHENGFNFSPGPVVTAQHTEELQLASWGLIPWWVKDKAAAEQIKTRTLNCISEEMFDKPSFRDALKAGKRCLVPCTGFFEWRHFNGGKDKYPYFISLKEQKLFSLAGVYSDWTDKSTGETVQTYSVLTTQANSLMEVIHNSKKRMPVILPREYEKDWLNENLTKQDVLSLCTPLDADKMQAHTISKMITDRKAGNKNVPEISKQVEYPELALLG